MENSRYLIFTSAGRRFSLPFEDIKIIIVVIMKLSQMELLFVHLQNVLIAFHQMDQLKYKVIQPNLY